MQPIDKIMLGVAIYGVISLAFAIWLRRKGYDV